ncbi:hypothetical protein HYH02_007038 [Chlamydomonas schloesseri]|uniref:Uncharacterized protein n=1 Tax=Chlamydomonas schloesseri TaxID=2026947 RepID=A0A836B5B7_9CHLO|nr:hypothetical protein HYH02_007038 [Chlamydomonas schloesseri]|eukprot:KAG2448010.1 hypothetical protein HYH02_007038 [Chlamydomonas schloesseri]
MPATPLRTGTSLPLPSALARTLSDLLGLAPPSSSSSSCSSSTAASASASCSSGHVSVKTPGAAGSRLLMLGRSSCCSGGSAGAVLQLVSGTGASTDGISQSSVWRGVSAAPGVPSIPEGAADQSTRVAASAAHRTAALRPPTFLVALAPFDGSGCTEPVLVAATLRKSTVRSADDTRAPTQPATPNPAHADRGTGGFGSMHADSMFDTPASPRPPPPPPGINSLVASLRDSSPQAAGPSHRPSRRRVRVSLRLHSLPSLALSPAAVSPVADAGPVELQVAGYDVFVSAGGRHVALVLHVAAVSSAAATTATQGATAATAAAATAAAATPGASEDGRSEAAAGVEELEEGELMQEQERAALPAAAEDVEMEASEDGDTAAMRGATPPLPHRLQLRTALSSPPSFSGWGSVTTAGPAVAAAPSAAAAAADEGADAGAVAASVAVQVGGKRRSDADCDVALDNEARRQRTCVRGPSGSSATGISATDLDKRRRSSGGAAPADAATATVDEALILSPMPSPAHHDDPEAEAAADARAATMHIDVANTAGINHVGIGSAAEDVDAAAAAIMRSPRCVPEAALLGVAALRAAQAEAEELRAELEAARRAQRTAEGTAHRLRGEMRTRLGMERMALQRIEEILESQQAALRQAEARAREAGEAAELRRRELVAEVEARAAAERRVWEFRALAERPLQI